MPHQVRKIKKTKIIELIYESVPLASDCTEQGVDRAFDVLFEAILINNKSKNEKKN